MKFVIGFFLGLLSGIALIIGGFFLAWEWRDALTGDDPDGGEEAPVEGAPLRTAA